jgi:hypothetical protein
MMGFHNFDPDPMTKEEAQQIIDAGNTYFDYLKGRVMKIDISGDSIYPGSYDRDNGQGALEKAILALKTTKETNPQEVIDTHISNTKEEANNVKEFIDEETKINSNGGIVTMTLGLAEFKDVLIPKVDKALEDIDTLYEQNLDEKIENLYDNMGDFQYSKRNKGWTYAALGVATIGIIFSIYSLYSFAKKNNQSITQTEIIPIEHSKTETKQLIIADSTSKLETNLIYTKTDFFENARKFGLTGIYTLITGKSLNEITSNDYKFGGPIHQLAKHAGIDLFDETKEPEEFNKNDINDLMTINQTNELYKKINKLSFK